MDPDLGFILSIIGDLEVSRRQLLKQLNEVSRQVEDLKAQVEAVVNPPAEDARPV